MKTENLNLIKNKTLIQVITIIITLVLYIGHIFTFSPIKVKAMTNEEITNAITNLQSKYPNGSYWIPTTEQKYGGFQCYAFARQCALDVFGSYPAVNVVYATEGQISNGWTARKNPTNITLEPGDIIRADYNAHSAMIWKLEGEYVYVVQCFGSSNDKINYGYFWGNHKKSTVSELLDDGFNGIWKHPNTNPDPVIEPEPEKPYVTATGVSLPSSPHPYETAFEITGILKSNEKIISVWGGAYWEDWSGPVEGAYVELPVNAYEYNLNGAFNRKVIFNRLPDNTRYHYLISVRTESGEIFHPIQNDFYVGDPGINEQHNHTMETKEVVVATCVTDGYEVKACSSCGFEEKTIIPAKGHDFIETSIPAECLIDGKEIKICKECGEKIETVIPKKGHHFSEAITIKEADCEISGILEKKCLECGEIESEIIPALGHEIIELNIDNKIVKKCIHSGCTYQDVISALVIGDINSDGKVDITDLSELSISLVDKKSFSTTQSNVADVNGDGEVGLTDLAKLRQFISKVIESL